MYTLGPLYSGHHWDPPVWAFNGLNSEVVLYTALCSCNNSALYREVFCIHSALYREVLL